MPSILFLIFNNETPLLLDRLAHDEQQHDLIVVGEADRTFAGRPKPLFLERYAEHLAGFRKLRCVPVRDLPLPDRSQTYIGSNGKHISENRWVVEHAMRNFPMRLLPELVHTHGADCRVTVCDVDEIVNPTAFSQELAEDTVQRHYFWDFRETLAASGLQPKPIAAAYSVRLGTLVKHGLSFSEVRRIHMRADGSCYGTGIASAWSLKNLDGTPVYPTREYPGLHVQHLHRPEFVGWHLSGMHGGKRALFSAKAESFAHAEYSRLPADTAFETPDIMAELSALPRPATLATAANQAPGFLVAGSRFPHYYLPPGR